MLTQRQFAKLSAISVILVSLIGCSGLQDAPLHPLKVLPR
jgi:hypothetical protein